MAAATAHFPWAAAAWASWRRPVYIPDGIDARHACLKMIIYLDKAPVHGHGLDLRLRLFMDQTVGAGFAAGGDEDFFRGCLKFTDLFVSSGRRKGPPAGRGFPPQRPRVSMRRPRFFKIIRRFWENSRSMVGESAHSRALRDCDLTAKGAVNRGKFHADDAAADDGQTPYGLTAG